MACFDGYNGQIVIEGAELLIEREGMVARATFPKGTHWQVPLRAVTGVQFEEASRLRNGWIRILVGGQTPPPPTRTSAASSGDAVLFTHKDRQPFAALRDWLAHVAATNAATDVPSTGAPPVPQSRLDPSTAARSATPMEAAQPAAPVSGPLTAPAPGQPTPGTPTRAPASQGRSGQANPLMLRGRGWFSQQVAGESHYEKALQRLAGRGTGEREVIALLERDPRNRYDANAIKVLIDGNQVGFLPREDAAMYQHALALVEQMGRAATCRARLWFSSEDDWFTASVSLDLHEPGLLLPVNAIDPAVTHVLLPPARSYQVTGEHEHLDALRSLIAQAYLPGKAMFYATLTVEDVVGARSTSEVVAVRIDGSKVGSLSKQTGAKLLPLLRSLTQRGVPVYVEAALTGNALAVEVTVSLTPTEELRPDLVDHITALTS